MVPWLDGLVVGDEPLAESLYCTPSTTVGGWMEVDVMLPLPLRRYGALVLQASMTSTGGVIYKSIKSHWHAACNSRVTQNETAG